MLIKYLTKNNWNILMKTISAHSKITYVKLLKIILQPPDTQTYVCLSGGYSMLIFKSFALRNIFLNELLLK